jgi:hypothetical protein
VAAKKGEGAIERTHRKAGHPFAPANTYMRRGHKRALLADLQKPPHKAWRKQQRKKPEAKGNPFLTKA